MAPLVYVNNVGRQTAFPEISGLYAHWIVEKDYEAIKVPQVEQAVLGLQAH